MKSLECFNEDSISILEKNKLLDPLIKAELIENILSSVPIQDDLRQSTIEKFLNESGFENEDKYNEWLIKNSVDKNQIEEIALNKVRLKSYCKENFGGQVDSRFLERKNHYDNVVYSLIRVKDYFKAREIYLRLESKESEFGDLAASYSEGNERRTRGIVGPVNVGMSHPDLIPFLINGKKGKIDPPFRVAGLYLILRVESYESAKLDQTMREQIVEELFNAWIDEEVKEKKVHILNELTTSSVTTGPSQ